MSVLELAATLTVVVLVLLAGLVFGLRRHTEQLLRRVGAAERQLGVRHGLTPPSAAPRIETALNLAGQSAGQAEQHGSASAR